MTRIKNRIFAILAAVFMLLTMPFSVFADSGNLGMIDMNQYAYSFNSSYPEPFAGVSASRGTRKTINGNVAYCVEFGVMTYTGVGYNSSTSWSGLTGSRETLVNYALRYGYTGTTKYGGNVDQEYWATQTLIWQIMYGTVNTGQEDSICNVLMGNGSVAKSIYYQIKDNVYNAQTIPSFASSSDNSSTPVHELTYNTATGLYEVTLTDTNGVLSAFDFQSSGYTMTRSGNSLHITSANPQELVTVSSSKNISSGTSGSILYWHSSGYQSIATYEPGGSSGSINAHFKLKLSMGNCEIVKSTEDGDNLTGISFTITGTNGVTRTGTVDATGRALVVGLPVGTYTVTENPNSHHPQYVTAPPQTITVQAGQTAEVSFNNRIKKGQISILKFEPSESDPLIKTPMSGVNFTVTRKDTGQVACTITTDADGYAITPLLNYGVYTVTETYVEGHTILDPFEVFVDTDGKVYHYLLENTIYESMLKIVKVDSETGQTIPYAGAKFKVLDASGNPVTQNIYYPTPTQISEFVTAADGTLVLPQMLSYGTYTLVEIEAPYGYLLNTDPLAFTISALNYTKMLEVKFKDAPAKGKIEINKVGEKVSTITAEDSQYGTVYQPVYEEIALPGVVFNVTANEDIYTLDGTLRYAKDTVVDTVTTGSDGKATTKALYLGSYRLEEVQTAAGYVLDTQPRYVTLEYADQYTAIVIEDILISNQRIKAALEFQKDMELGTGREDKPVANVVFGLYTRNDIVAADGTTIPAGSLMELITPKPDGTATIATDLPVSNYYIKELATAPGYILDEAEYDFEFSIEGIDIPLVELTINDGKVINNTITRGNAKLIKTNVGGGKVLSGAIFELYTIDGVLVGEYITDENGEIYVEELSYGEYYWQEKIAPKGYVKNDTPLKFSISEDGSIVVITATNEKVTHPKTGDNSKLFIWLIVAGSAIVATTATIILYRKKKAKADV